MGRGPDVEAIVTFLSTGEGGRAKPTFSGYRPVHGILPNYLTSGEHQYIDRTTVFPGESARTHITFITPEAYPHSLWPGKVITVQEGSRIIGQAEIVDVINPDLLSQDFE